MSQNRRIYVQEDRICFGNRGVNSDLGNRDPGRIQDVIDGNLGFSPDIAVAFVGPDCHCVFGVLGIGITEG